MSKPKLSATCIPPEKNSLLIGEVRKFPSLYDTCDPNYYVLAERNKAWLQVAENCDLPAELCHLRWKSLRKRYAKEKRRFPEILQGQRRPWALFPKMAFLTASALKRKIKPGVKPRAKLGSKKQTDDFKQNASDDDMLILDDNDHILHTCKSVDVSEEDEYIYDTLDDPDSALEIIKSSPNSKMKATAIRSGGAAGIPLAIQTRGPARIRRPTPKMQNSLIAKKLKQAQMVAHHVPSGNLKAKSNVTANKTARLQKALIDHCKDIDPNRNAHRNMAKTVLYQDKTTRHVATVNPNIIRLEKVEPNEDTVSSPPNSSDTSTASTSKRESETAASEGNRPFKVIKLKGRNPIIFSPEQLPDIKSFLKSESSSNKEQNEMKDETESPEKKSPVIKIKSVDNLNNENTSPTSEEGENRNLDIIHSVGLVRKTTAEKSTSVEKPIFPHQSYTRSYSWNRPIAKQTNSTTNNRNKQTATERIQPDSQTNDYEIEETWNDIKEENIDNDESWAQSPLQETINPPHESLMQSPESVQRVISWNRLNEAKLELVSYQRKLLEEQHKKNLEYMKKEHDLKMTLLKAEIDLKRKQLNIML